MLVRSFRGRKGQWYDSAATDGTATLVLDERRLPVRIIAVADPAVIAATSVAFLTKYAGSPYAQAMVRPDTLATTLRLEPA